MESFALRAFKNAWFKRFARKEKISDEVLWDAVERAEQGQVDADLGSGVIKQRIARSGRGKSNGYRTIILYCKGDKAFFVYAAAEQLKAAGHPVCLGQPPAALRPRRVEVIRTI